jgi:hypothetical protein
MRTCSTRVPPIIMDKNASKLLLAAVFSVSVALLGCPVGHLSPPARAQEAATELNVNTRFGRMELAAEKVSPEHREAFLLRRKAWGSTVRVADYELAGLQMKKGEADADVLVKVAWYRVDQGDLHITILKQKWHDFKGDWRLVDESRADGDVGLIGEPLPFHPSSMANAASGANGGEAPPQRKGAQFPTIRLGEPKADQPSAAPATMLPKANDGDTTD